MPRAKTKKPNPFAIRRGKLLLMQRNAQGFDVKQLALLSGLSQRTIRRAEKGNGVRGDTLAVLAKHLEMDYESLLALSDDKPVPPVSDRTKLTFSLEVPKELIVSTGEAQKFLDLVKQFIAANDKFINPVVDIGSTLLTFELTLADARRLCQHFSEGRLKQFHIVSVQVPNDDADRKRRIQSLLAMSEGMTGIVDESDMLRRETAIRFAFRLVLSGKCDKQIALQTAERAMMLQGNEAGDLFAQPLLEQISNPESGKKLSEEIAEFLQSARREASATAAPKED